MRYFIWLNEEQKGPFEESDVQNMITLGEIEKETFLYVENSGLDWVQARELFPQETFADNSSDRSALKAMPPVLQDGSSSVHYSVVTGLEIQLSSGMILKIKSIRLYDEIDLANVNAKKTEAMKLFQGVSTGIGAIGSIGWVLATSAIIGAVESAMSSSARSTGVRLLEEALRLDEYVRANGVLCPISRIQNIQSPEPGLWRVPWKRELKQKVQSVTAIKYEVKEVSTAFIHNGEDFVFAVTEDNAAHSIRWSQVERYSLVGL